MLSKCLLNEYMNVVERMKRKEWCSAFGSILPVCENTGTNFLLNDFFFHSADLQNSVSQIPSAFYAGETEKLSFECRLLHVLILIAIWQVNFVV